DEATEIGYRSQSGEMYVDRQRSGLNQFISREGKSFDFGKQFVAVHAAQGKQVKLRLFVDESIVELFVDDGHTVFTTLIYPDPLSQGIELFAEDGSATFISVHVYEMSSIWK